MRSYIKSLYIIVYILIKFSNSHKHYLLLTLFFLFYKGYAQWTQVSTVIHKRWECATLEIDRNLYVFGGIEDGFNISNHIETYNVDSRVWTDLGEMPYFVFHQGTAVVGNEIWMAGGRDGGFKDTDTVLIYNTETNNWRAGPSLPGIRAGGDMINFEGKLYFVSGMEVTDGFPGNCPNEASYNDLFVLDPNAPEEGWKSLAPTLNSLNHFALTVAHNRIYLIGGQEGHDCVGINSSISGNGIDVNSTFEYDPVTNTWEKKADLPAPRSHNTDAIFTYNGRIYLLGGEGPAINMFIYDPINDVWEDGPDLPIPLMSPSATVFDDKIVLAYGAAGGGADLFGQEETYEFNLINDTSNNEPRISPISNQTVSVADQLLISVSANDPDPGDVISYSALGLPDGLTIDSLSGEILGTITGGVGNYRVIVTVSDGDSSSSDAYQAFTIEVVSDITLSVEFDSFNVWRSQGAVNLFWETSLEEGVDYFEIQRSFDGTSFQAIGSIKPAIGGSYVFEDHSEKIGTRYYRIKGVDIDGTEYFSNIRQVILSNISVAVYPNPGESNFSIELEALSRQKLNLTLIDMRGAYTWNDEQEMDQGLTVVKPDWDGLAPGIYTLLVEGNNVYLPLKVAIQ